MSAGHRDAARRVRSPEHRHGAVHLAPSAGQEGGDDLLAVRGRVHLVGGEAGRTLAAAQGRALAALLATLGEMEVGQGEEDSP